MKRDANVDLCRILATLFVIVLHILGQGGILDTAEPNSTNYWVAWFLEILTYCAVNCFALISGYIMVDKAVKTRRLIDIWFQVLFYSVSITALFFIFLPETRTAKNLVYALFPIVGKQWWYASSYFALFFLMPLLNAAIKHISQRTYQKILISIVFGICVVDCIFPPDAFALANGYSAAWLAVGYLFGAYIRKFNLKETITASKSILGYFVVILLTFMSKVGIRFLTKSFLGTVIYDNALISYTSITILMASIFLLLFCLNVKIGITATKIIHFFSPVTLSVYLIHVHPLVFEFVIKDAFIPFAHKDPVIMFFCVMAAMVVIFILCAIMDLLRIQLFKLPWAEKLFERIAQGINKLYLRVFPE